jgi:large subunit ribosomal protein L23
MDKAMTIKPRISEKAYALSQTQNVYVLQVPSDANRLMVADAVTAQFGVTVTKVNISNAKGKVKRTVRKGGRQTFGKRPDTKKAYVTLKEGDSIAIFATDDDEKKNDKAAEKSKKAPRSAK